MPKVLTVQTVEQSPAVQGQRQETLVEEGLYALKAQLGFHGNKPEVVLTSWDLKVTDTLFRDVHHTTSTLQKKSYLFSMPNSQARRLGAAIWVLRIEPRPSGRAASALNH